MGDRAVLLGAGLLAVQPAIERHSWRPSFDDDSQGAVLCAWMIHVGAQRIGHACFPDDQDTLAAIDDAVERMDRFIIANMPTTRATLDAARLEALRSSRIPRDLEPSRCRAASRELRDIIAFYRMVRELGPTALRDETTRLLATPRRPSMKPCL